MCNQAFALRSSRLTNLARCMSNNLYEKRRKAQNPVLECTGLLHLPGSDLLSQGLPPQVSSALEGLTVVFGMGTRVSPPL
jgi:hypothetical protein